MKIEDLKSWKRIGCLISVIGGLLFIFLTLIAMLLYPGGYSFLFQTFSYLGFVNSATNGANNSISRLIFLIACTIAAFSLIPFWIIAPSLFSERSTTKYLSLLGSLCGVISTPFLVLLAIYPGDTHYVEHITTTNAFFLLFAAAILIYSIAIFLNPDYQNIYAFVGIAFSIFITLYPLVFRQIYLIRGSTQKIIVYGFILWVIFQVTKIWKVVGPLNNK